MITVTEITIHNVENLAMEIVKRMPEFEIDPDRFDEFGEFDESFEFDIEFSVEGLQFVAVGKVRSQGYCKSYDTNDRWVAPSCEINQVNEIQEVDFYIDDTEVQISNGYDLENRINELLSLVSTKIQKYFFS